MNIQLNIEYDWWHVEYDEIPEDHKEGLKEHAEKRILEMIQKDYHSGELNTYIDNEHYLGWWELRQRNTN